MGNFTFLKSDWPELFETTRKAGQSVGSTPLTLQLSHRLYARCSLERVVKWLDSYLKQPYADKLAALGFDSAQPPIDARSLSQRRSLSGVEGASFPRSSPLGSVIQKNQLSFTHSKMIFNVNFWQNDRDTALSYKQDKYRG